MTNKSQFSLFLILIMVFLAGKTVAQSSTAGDIISLQVQDYCLIDTNQAPVSLTLSTSTAGSPVTSVSNSAVYVKVSSVVPVNTYRSMTARISGGVVPPFTKLSLVASPCTVVNSGGNLGTVVSTPIILSSTDQNIITLIGSCFTGTWPNDGYKLTYTWYPDSPATNYSFIVATPSPITITILLTITSAI